LVNRSFYYKNGPKGGVLPHRRSSRIISAAGDSLMMRPQRLSQLRRNALQKTPPPSTVSTQIFLNPVLVKKMTERV